MSDFTKLELLQAHAYGCPTELLAKYSAAIDLIKRGFIVNAHTMLNDIAFDYGQPTFDMPIWNDRLLELLIEVRK